MEEFKDNEQIQIRKIENKYEETKIVDTYDMDEEVKKEDIGEIKNNIKKGNANWRYIEIYISLVKDKFS